MILGFDPYFRDPYFLVKDKKLFPGESELPNRACPTTGSDRGSLRDHDLTLIVRLRYVAVSYTTVSRALIVPFNTQGLTLIRKRIVFATGSAVTVMCLTISSGGKV